ncbi:MAG: 50S ribosomal protein L19 [Candidatus Pacebacteria bacterium]|nr:50S ribosomal protein L19 [Candidatus Paceibacterota bacterium]MDD5013333.1 50S ribosomal protein L19 [Candidatus Paceibacterota bacterium]MDD5752810.1 50S ribosomal protein L19 [Candidatus Paceibacterota bacterium]
MEEEAKTETVEQEEIISKQEPEEKGIVESFLKQDLSEIKQGDTVKVYQKIKDKVKDKLRERIQIFEGQVLAVKHGKGINATITVRKVIQGIGVEKVFPIHSPLIEKIEIVKRTKTRRAKLYYLRKAKGRKARLKIVENKKEEKEGE